MGPKQPAILTSFLGGAQEMGVARVVDDNINKPRHSGIVHSTPVSAPGTFGANAGRGDALRSALTGLLLLIRNLLFGKLKRGRFRMFFSKNSGMTKLLVWMQHRMMRHL
jgi:hypothetical protein